VDKDGNRRVSNVSSEIFTKFLEMSETIIDLGDREKNFTSFVLLSRFSEGSFSSDGCFVVVGEENDSWVLLLEDLRDSSIIERHDSSEGVRINEFLQILQGNRFSEIVSSFIELLEQDKVSSSSFIGFSQFSAKDMSECNIIIGHSKVLES
jgi:hypothetical protein